MHEHSWWLARAQDIREPLRMRVFYLALGSPHAHNGHVSFQDGEIAEALKINDRNDILDRANREAKKRSFLDELSCKRCLVVPQGIEGGEGGGKAHALCAYHDGVQRRSSRARRPRKSPVQATTAETAERSGEANSDTITPPLDLVQAARNQQVSVSSNVVPLRTGATVTQSNCYGCRAFGQACTVHGEAWNTFRQLNSHDIERLRTHDQQLVGVGA